MLAGEQEQGTDNTADQEKERRQELKYTIIAYVTRH